jgi:hypothetical protein
MSARRSIKFEQHKRRFSHYMLNLDRNCASQQPAEKEEEELKECTFQPFS